MFNRKFSGRADKNYFCENENAEEYRVPNEVSVPAIIANPCKVTPLPPILYSRHKRLETRWLYRSLFGELVFIDSSDQRKMLSYGPNRERPLPSLGYTERLPVDVRNKYSAVYNPAVRMLWEYAKLKHITHEGEENKACERALHLLINDSHGSVKKFGEIGGQVDDLPKPLQDEIRRCPTAFETLSKLEPPKVKILRALMFEKNQNLADTTSVLSPQSLLPRVNNGDQSNYNFAQRTEPRDDASIRVEETRRHNDFDACSIIIKKAELDVIVDANGDDMGFGGREDKRKFCLSTL